MEDNKVNVKKSGFLMNLLKSIGTNLNRMISYDPSLDQITNNKTNYLREDDCYVEEPTLPLNEEQPVQYKNRNTTESSHKIRRNEYITDPIMRTTNYINEESNESPQKVYNDHNITCHNSYKKNNSLLSHKTQRKEELVHYSDVSMMTLNQSAQQEMNKSNVSMRTLDEIKSEIDTKRKENIRKIKELADKSLFVNISDDVNRAFEEKKKILVDYYNKKAEKIKEVALIMEKERLKREDNFNHLTRTKNNSFAVKGKEKKKHLEIKKNNELFIEKVEKKNISFEVNKSNVTMNNSSLFDKKPEEKKPATLLSGTSPLFGNNTTEKDKPSEPISVNSSLFNPNNKSSTISFAAPDNKLFAPQSQIAKTERKSSTTIFPNPNPSVTPIASDSLFSSNNKKDNEPKQNLFGASNKEETKKEDDNQTKQPLFGSLNNTKSEGTSLLFTNDTSKPKSSLFESNQPPVTNKVEPITNPASSQTLKSTGSNGSLLTENNPFLANNKNQPPKVFSSPEKKNDTSSPLFGSNMQSNNNQPSQSLFGNNARPQGNTNIFNANPTTTSNSGGLFASNNPPTQNNGSLFGNNQTTSTNLFSSNNPPNSSQPSSSLFGTNSTTNKTGGLFGSNQPTNGVLFGNNNTTAQPTTGGLFGNNNTTAQPTTGGLFGNSANTSTEKGSLFTGGSFKFSFGK